MQERCHFHLSITFIINLFLDDNLFVKHRQISIFSIKLFALLFFTVLLFAQRMETTSDQVETNDVDLVSDSHMTNDELQNLRQKKEQLRHVKGNAESERKRDLQMME